MSTKVFSLNRNRTTGRRQTVRPDIVLWLFVAIATVLVLAFFGGCGSASPKNVAILDTDAGEIVIELFPDKAPRHVEQFERLARSGFYDGVLIHRVVPGFIIQTGDPLTKDASVPRSRYGSGGSGNCLKPEFNDLRHLRGMVGMARTADPQSNDSLFYDTADSQFYICVADQPHLDGKYTIFGKVIAGMDVVDRISLAERDALNIPLHPIRVRSIKIISKKEHEKNRKQLVRESKK